MVNKYLHIFMKKFTSKELRGLLVPKNIIIVLVAMLAASLIGGVYFYKKANADPQKIAQEELNDTIAAVSRLMVLPSNETPTMATVTDPEKLKDQRFFVNAKRGDRVLIYTLAGKAILYSPTLNKIIEVAPVNTAHSQAGSR